MSFRQAKRCFVDWRVNCQAPYMYMKRSPTCETTSLNFQRCCYLVDNEVETHVLPVLKQLRHGLRILKSLASSFQIRRL